MADTRQFWPWNAHAPQPAPAVLPTAWAAQQSAADSGRGLYSRAHSRPPLDGEVGPNGTVWSSAAQNWVPRFASPHAPVFAPGTPGPSASGVTPGARPSAIQNYPVMSPSTAYFTPGGLSAPGANGPPIRGNRDYVAPGGSGPQVGGDRSRELVAAKAAASRKGSTLKPLAAPSTRGTSVNVPTPLPRPASMGGGGRQTVDRRPGSSPLSPGDAAREAAMNGRYGMTEGDRARAAAMNGTYGQGAPGAYGGASQSQVDALAASLGYGGAPQQSQQQVADFIASPGAVTGPVSPFSNQNNYAASYGPPATSVQNSQQAAAIAARNATSEQLGSAQFRETLNALLQEAGIAPQF